MSVPALSKTTATDIVHPAITLCITRYIGSLKLMFVTETAEKIKSMEIRGAGRIARAAAGALRDHALSLKASDHAAFRQEMEQAAATLVATRPTAVSLPNAVHFVMAGLGAAKTAREAQGRV